MFIYIITYVREKTIVLRIGWSFLYFLKDLAESLEIPSATLLLILAAPNDFVESFRDNLRMRDVANVCLFTSCYLLNKHTKACGGYKNSFTQKDKITCTICLYVLLVYPIWSTFAYLF